ncbi:hypothetical protein OROMI_009346 [Orobanche minor]
MSETRSSWTQHTLSGCLSRFDVSAPSTGGVLCRCRFYTICADSYVINFPAAFFNLSMTIDIIKDMYEGASTSVRTNVGRTEEFPITIGVHQGSALSPFLFAIVMDELTRGIQNDVPWCMMFADDIVLIDETKVGVQQKLELWRDTLEARGFRLSRSKTEYMECRFSDNSDREAERITFDGKVVHGSTFFRYLGSIIQKDGELDGDVAHRIKAGWLKWKSATGVLCDPDMPHRLKGKFYRTAIRPALLYGTECWAVKQCHVQKMNVAEMRMLRWMCGHTKKDRLRNEVIREKVRVASIEDKMMENRLRWFGHVRRRPVDAPVRRLESWGTSNIVKGRGRPKKTWIKLIENDMRFLGIRESMAMERQIWRERIRVFQSSSSLFFTAILIGFMNLTSYGEYFPSGSNSRKRKSYAAMDGERKAALLHSRRVKYNPPAANIAGPLAPTTLHMLSKIEIIPLHAWSLPFSSPCPLCGAVLYLREPRGFCYLRGQISLPLPRMPRELWNLYTSLNSSDAVHFRKRCRTYNNTTAFSSLGITYDETFAKSNKGVYTLRIQGGVYHFIRDLIPGEGPGRQLQLYFYEPENELENRLSQSGDLQLHILQRIVELMRPNPYALFFRGLQKLPNLQEYNIVLRADPSLDMGLYSLPTVNQVAAIWHEITGVPAAQPHDIRRLAQQYQIDCYVKIETQHLDYLRSEQLRENLRTESFDGIIDSMACQGKVTGFDIGKKFVLPASYVGSPRDMRRRYLNALALVSEYGRPDFFITMTCNPNWPEMRAGLLPGEEAQNRSDLVARAFRGRHEEFKNEILRQKIFGEVAAYLYI